MSFTRNLKTYLTSTSKLDGDDGGGGGGVDGLTLDTYYDDDDGDDGGDEEGQVVKWSSSVEDYAILEPIGSGSFGQVYRARATHSTRYCAIKSIAKKRSPNYSKILSEVSIHLRLRHRHVLRLWTVVEDGDHVYLVMELCSGGSLAQWITRQVAARPQAPIHGGSVLPYESIAMLIRQLCAALQYLHRNSIVHRDLNTNNILLVKPVADWPKASDDLWVKLADFGLALDLGQRGSSGTICGTPGYIPPEVWNANRVGNAVDFRADIFSLGSVVYACVAGSTPKGELDLSTFNTMPADLITRLLDHRPEYRPSLAEILAHPFTCGRINSTRLNPIHKSIHKVAMSIGQDHHVLMTFPQGITFKVIPDGSEVTVSHGGKEATYPFYDLPQKYWNRFAYLTRFVGLVRSKTAKITLNCPKGWCPIATTGHYVSKCTLMESGTIEVCQCDPSHPSDEAVRWSLEQPRRPDLSRQAWHRLQLLKVKMKEVESKLEAVGSELNLQPFPVNIGLPSLDGLKSQGLLQRPKSLVLESSQVLRSVSMHGIGLVTQFDNGSLQVTFDDGSDLAVDGDSHIFYLEHGVLKRFHKDELLPAVVVDKLSRMPQVIEHLRQQIHKPHSV